MKLKDLVEPQAVKSMREINERMADLSKRMSLSSPLMEYMHQIEDQQKRLNDHFRGISQSISLAMPSYTTKIEGIARSLTPLAEQIARMHDPLQEAMKRFQEQTRPLNELAQQFQSFQERLNFSEINRAFRGITDAIQIIPREQLIKARLHSEYWLVGDDKILVLAMENDLYKSKDIIPFVIGYYKTNNWKQLERLVEEWQKDIEPGRLDIFQAAIAMSKDADPETVHLLTVPALIAQIDGLVRDLYSVLPKAARKRAEKEIKKALPVELQDKRIDVRHDVAVLTITEIVDFWSAEMLQEVIFSGLFRDSNKIIPDESYSLFRHKIMHGDKEYLRYGNEENFIRLMLYADFIIKLIIQINNGNISIDKVA